MERKILVANTKTQKRYTLNADVSTLGELKSVLDNNNIDYSGMSFTEGVSNTQLIDDSSQLPHDVNYKGKTTNDLVIILTNTTKNIPSGTISEARANAFSFIKSHNLQERVKKEFGRNMTQVSQPELENFIHLYGNEETEDDTPEETSEKPEEKSELDNMADDILSQHGFNDDTEKDDTEEEESNPYVRLVSELVYHLMDDALIDDETDLDNLIDNIRRGQY